MPWSLAGATVAPAWGLLSLPSRRRASPGLPACSTARPPPGSYRFAGQEPL